MLPFPLQIAAPLEEPTFLESLGESLSSSEFWFQMVVLVGLAPVWFPILRAIYRELDRSLRDQGGVFGRDYTEVEKKRLAAADDPADDLPLRSVPHHPRAGGGRPGGDRAHPTPRASSGGRAGGPLRSSRGRGF